MAAKAGASVTLDNVANVIKSINFLATTRVLVGFPADKGIRDDGPISNAALGYIHEHGAPEANIPARPFLEPTVKKKENDLTLPALKSAGFAALSGEPDKSEKILSKLGQEMADAVRDTIVAGIDPPIKDETIIARRTRLTSYRKATKEKKSKLREMYLEEGGTPLIDTGQMLRAITWVLRKWGKTVS